MTFKDAKFVQGYSYFISSSCQSNIILYKCIMRGNYSGNYYDLYTMTEPVKYSHLIELFVRSF